MGHESLVYGVIVGSRWKRDDAGRLHRLNRERISLLPDTDDWPFLTRAIFSIVGDSFVEGTYRSQPIHFAATMKAVEWEWHEWLPKFEGLLRDLYWTEAHLHLRTEATVGHHDYVYTAKNVLHRLYESEPPLPSAEWDFVGGPREFSDR